MKSTGEVMGVGMTFGEAFVKSQMGAGVKLPESGKVFCLSTGPSKEAVMRVHETSGHPTTQVYEVSVDVR